MEPPSLVAVVQCHGATLADRRAYKGSQTRKEAENDEKYTYNKRPEKRKEKAWDAKKSCREWERREQGVRKALIKYGTDWDAITLGSIPCTTDERIVKYGSCKFQVIMGLRY